MKKVLLIAGVLALAGCASLPDKILSSSPRSVVLETWDGVGVAQKIADKECQRHSRLARLLKVDVVTYYFDCVE